MKRVMRMKKGLIGLLAAAAVLAAVFLWKGGHHALFVSSALEEWLDTNTADQTLIVQYQKGGFSVDSETGKLSSNVEQWSISADTFWTQYGDDRVFGLSANGMTAYVRGNVLYMDTGKAYTLPELSAISDQADRLTAGLILRGRMTKTGDTYNLTMKTDELDLSASFTVAPNLQMLTVNASLPDDVVLRATLTPKDPQAHPLPQAVSDAMVRTSMESPLPLTQPLEVLLPALRNLYPLSGELTIGVESGILELSETVDFRMTAQKAELDRKGITISFDLPDSMNQLQPELLALGLLYNGTYTQEGETTQLQMDVPGETAADLITRLIPQAADLGLTCERGKAVLTIEGDKLVSAAITAEASVPFFMTTIPLSFTADLMIP